MTAIAWDGRTLAADKRATTGGHIYTVTKIARVGDSLVGFSGRYDRFAEFQRWLIGARDQETYPKRDSNESHWIAIVIRRVDSGGSRIERYEDSALPIIVEDPQHAIGCGRDYARAAMHCGKTAAEAVAIACLFDENCGNGIDELSLEDAP